MSQDLVNERFDALYNLNLICLTDLVNSQLVQQWMCSYGLVKPTCDSISSEQHPILEIKTSVSNSYSPPASPKKKQSKKLLKTIPTRPASKEFLLVPEYSVEMTQLRDIVRNRKHRNALINDLISETSNCLMKIRFCAAIEEYEIIPLQDKIERKAKARKIVSMFVHTGSMFQLSGIPHSIEQGLLNNEKFDPNLSHLKAIFYEELSQFPFVQKAMQKFPVRNKFTDT